MEPVSDGTADVTRTTRIADDGRVTESLFEFEEIGVWSELKLEIVEKYGAAYTNAFKKSGASRSF